MLGQNCQVDDDANVSGAIVWADSRIGARGRSDTTPSSADRDRSAATPPCAAACSETRRPSRNTAAYESTIFSKPTTFAGIYPAELDEQSFHQIGRAFVAYLKAKRIGVGRDMRMSSPSLAAAFIAGAREQGADVIDYGMIATDMIYYAVATDDLDGGAQITASHNPKQYNGCKMVGRGNHAAQRRQGISDIRDMIAGNRIPPPAATPGVSPSGRSWTDTSSTCSASSIRRIIKPFKVVLDAGCGMAGLVAPELFKALPCKVDASVFHDRRHLPHSRSQSADRREPPRHRRAG